MLGETKFLELYQLHQESGLTVREFCSNEGIASSTFYYLHKKVKKKNAVRDFIPLLVNSSQPVPVHANVSNPPSDSSSRNTVEGMLLEVAYPNGTRLRINQEMDLAHLQILVCLLD